MAAVALIVTSVSASVVCTSDWDCSLNGACGDSGICACNAPWTGSTCGELGFAVSATSAKDVFPASDTHNTWGGPMAGPDHRGLFHMYVPIYDKGQLFGAKRIKHGVAASPSGPYDWTGPDIAPASINPALLVYRDAANKTVYSLWMANYVLIADSLDGNFTRVPGFKHPGGANPAPLWHDGAFYITTQHTQQIWRLPGSTLRADLRWSVFANISHAGCPPGTVPEDPFMWIDSRGRWHIVNHAYDVSQLDRCASSTVSTHFFSSDGVDWRLGSVQPYGHVVHYDDGSSHIYTTLERPFLRFNQQGTMTHLVLAADLTTGDEGCANRTGKHAGPNGTACTNCKYGDHAGTVVVTLQS